MWMSSYLNSELGNSLVITNALVGMAYIIIALNIKFTKVVRLEYRSPLAICIAGAGVQALLRIFSVPPLVQTSLDTLVTMVAVAVAIVLIRDSAIR